MVFRLDNVGKEFGGNWLFRGVSAQCNPSERIGLIGRNGCGKSTLTALISGSLEPDEGRVQRSRPLQISSVEQTARLDPDLSILEEVLKVFAPLSRIQDELHRLEAQMSEAGGGAFDKAAEAYEGLQLRFQLQGGYDFKARAQSMLLGLGFSAAEFEMPCRNLSGGQKTRILLIKALASPGQMMLLDEPTNHLDLSAILWLTQFLQTLKTPFVLVSHDRRLLDQVTTRTWELEGGGLHDYPGPFSRSRELRRQRRTLKEQEYFRQQELRRRTEDFIRRNIMGQKTKQAQSRRKMLEKLKPLEKPLEETRSLKIQLQESARGGALSMSIEEGEVGYPEKPLLINLSLRIGRGDRVGILGGNGSGKSTLLKVLVGELSLLSGRLDVGLNNCFMYYSQNPSIGDGERTVYDFLRELDTYSPDEDIRSLAARFLFSQDDIFKKLNQLSGGERSRLALAHLFFFPSNVLVMDEPTNHLDIDSREALEDSLSSYSGTLLIVSHDLYFLKRVANHFYLIENQGLVPLEDLDELFGRRVEEEQVRKPKGVPPKKVVDPPAASRELSKNERRRRQLRMSQLESEIETLEKRKEEISESLQATDEHFTQLQALAQEHQRIQLQLGELYQDWERVAEDLSNVSEP